MWPAFRWRLPVGPATGPRVYLAGRDTRTGVNTAGGVRTVVLLHGGASNHRWWDPVARLLAPWHRVIWWDHRGHGRSDPCLGACTIDRLAADTVDILSQLATPTHGTRDVVLVGHSAGAAVALSVAAGGGPVPVAGVVCVEGGLYDPRLVYGKTWPQARTMMLTDRRRHTTPQVINAWLPAAGLPLEARAAVLGNFVPAGAGRLKLRVPAAQEEQLAHSLWSTNLTRLLPAISCPVLAVVADTGDPADTAARRRSLRAARRLLNGFLFETLLPGGHDLPLQQPGPVAAGIAQLTALVHGHTRRSR